MKGMFQKLIDGEPLPENARRWVGGAPLVIAPACKVGCLTTSSREYKMTIEGGLTPEHLAQSTNNTVAAWAKLKGILGSVSPTDQARTEAALEEGQRYRARFAIKSPKTSV